jgi:hypothetical protein
MSKISLLLMALLLAGGCATTKESDDVVALTDAQRAQLAKGARAPESFGLTVYDSAVGAVFAGGNRVHPEDVALLPMAPAGGSTAAIVAIESGTSDALLALVDTSSRESWATLRAAVALRTTVLGSPPFARKAVHAYDEFGGYASASHQVKLGTMNVESALFNIRAANGPLGQLARGLAKPRPEVVLGNNLLRSCAYVQLDFPKRSVVFSASTPYRPAEDLLVASLPLKDVQGALACEGAVNGDPATILLDTGADFAFAMKEPTDAEMRQVSIGDLVFRKVPATDSLQRGLGMPDYPRIGRGLMSRFKITFDFRKKLVHFEKP